MKSRPLPLAVSVGILAAVYLATASFGLHLFAVGGFAAPIWPPTGIALAAVSLYGTRLWPGVALGALLANLVAGAPLPAAAAIAAGNTLEALLGAYLLRHVVGFRNRLDRLCDVLGLIVLAALGSTLVSPTIGVTSLHLAGAAAPGSWGRMWGAWWMGDVMGDLLVAPLLFTWSRRPRSPLPPRPALEAAALLLALVAVSLLVFGDLFSTTLIRFPHLLFPLLIWAALRFAEHGAVTANFIVSAIAVWATTRRLGPFAQASMGDSLLSLLSFMGVVTVTILILAANVCERKRLEAALRKRADDLVEEGERRGDYLSVLAHELRGPLAPIRTAAEVFKRLAPAEPRLEKAQQIIERQVSQQAHLIDDLLNVTRLRHGKMVLRRERVELAGLVRNAVEDARALTETAGIELALEVPEAAIWIDGDATRLAQVLTNLMDNATKFTEPGGHVTVRLSRSAEGSRAVMTVQDNGVGIEPRMLSHIFTSFTQADRSRDRSPGGLGLGLALVKGLVELHGGEVRAYSDGPGRGSEFVVLLPLEREG
jgi:signal transduction histidine kinase